MTDFDVERCTRHCATTGRALVDGELFHSVLVRDGARLKRLDYCEAGWNGPPPEAVATWKSRYSATGPKPPPLAPSDVLLELFRNLQGDEGHRETRYVLALLLVRRRVLRLEDTAHDAHGETLHLHCGRDDSRHEVPVAMPDPARAQAIQDELQRLLAPATAAPSSGS